MLMNLAIRQVGPRVTLVLLTGKINAWEGNYLIVEHTDCTRKGQTGHRGTHNPGFLSLCFTLFLPQAGKIGCHPQGQTCPNPLGKLAEGKTGPSQALRARLAGRGSSILLTWGT